MKKYILLLFSLVYGIGVGQEIPKVIPPSPETATILQHSPINVSLYTGTPNISVPFYTISYGGVEVPISLSYNSDGIRVENIASWAGLGWSLNAGGLISRTINKLPDDASIGYMNTTYTIADFMERDSSVPDSIRIYPEYLVIPYAFMVNASFGPEDQGWQLSHRYGDGEYRDYEPDIFNFSFLNYSGQFYYNQEENEFNQAPLSNLKIETIKDSGVIQGFIITDEAGIKYHFGISKDGNRTAREKLTDARTKSITYEGIFESDPPFSIGAMNCYQSWMLLDIEFPISDKMIHLNYSTENNVETYVLTNEEFIKADLNGCQRHDINYLKKKFDQPKIANIIFPTGKVVFEKDTTERLDLNNSFALKSMQLLDNSDTIIKKIQLHTSYSESLSVNTDVYPVFVNPLEGSYRLRLDSLSIEDKYHVTSGRYVFDYDTQKLPNRYSKSIDYFGYYNGKNNTSFLPRTYHYAVGTMGSYTGTADRSINPAFTQSSVLKRISYPTGGYDEFEWENNIISWFADEGFAEEGFTYRDYLIDKTVHLTSDLYLFGDPDSSIDFSTEFTIQEGLFGAVDFSIMMTGCDNPSSPNLNQISCDFELEIVGVSNPNFNYDISQSNFSINSQDLPPGTYKITAKSRMPYVDPNQQTGSGPFPMFQLTAKWSYDPTPGEWFYDGLRVKEIKTYDKEGSMAFSKSYDYRYINNFNNISSGFTLNMIDVMHDKYLFNCPGGNQSLGDASYKLSSNSIAPLIPTKGSLVGYKYVTERFDGALRGRNEYQYTYIGEITDLIISGGLPYYFNHHIPRNMRNKIYCDWLRGNVEKEETFDSGGQKLRSKVYEYETANRKTVITSGIQTLLFPTDVVGVVLYPALTEYHRLKRMTETNYFNNGTDEVTLTKEYMYNALSQVSRERVFDNNHLDKKTQYFYPSDESMSGRPRVAELVAQNRIGTPLLTQTFQGNTQELSSQETVYNDFGGGLLLPKVIQTSKGGATMEDRIKYNAYDENGNLLEVEKKDGMKISYIWGYYNTQPVAKLENIAYNDIPGHLIAAIQGATNLPTNTEQDVLDALSELRISLSDRVMITTLTYKPLIGVSTITDPKGLKTTYEYDSFGRLKSVKDNEGNLLSENEYHYRTQN